HAAEIATWVDKKTEIYSVTNNPYTFKLLLRGTKDGFTKESFWKICNKQANTIVVMKVKNTDEILGGHNPIRCDKSN
ncbi:7983_t:CDS:1, partial [Ambispora leptoticha]